MAMLTQCCWSFLVTFSMALLLYPINDFFKISYFPKECRDWLSSLPCSVKWSSFPPMFMCSKSKLLQYLKQRCQGKDRSLLTSRNYSLKQITSCTITKMIQLQTTPGEHKEASVKNEWAMERWGCLLWHPELEGMRTILPEGFQLYL